MSFKVQTLVFPNLAISAPETMYLRLHKNPPARLSGRVIEFRAEGEATFDTFFNGLSVGKWKEKCDLKDLHIGLEGDGVFHVRIGLHRLHRAHTWLADEVVSLSKGAPARVELPFWPDLKDGMLYVSLVAVEGGRLTGGYFATDTKPVRNVKLGIVITHFNRKEWVLPAIRRIREEILLDPSYADHASLIVVDNSQNIIAEEAEGAVVIANQNLGGSGGFTRGLMYLEDQQDFTHCLFMDDDASCEIESIRRTISMFQFCTSDGVAIAGSLLYDTSPNLIHECGAVLNRAKAIVSPVHHRRNAEVVPDLLWLEDDTQADYGAWWFFGFQLSRVRSYPFPFFVRGDDVVFGVMNKFEVVTLNGIACWGEDFAYKDSPLTRYLSLRSYLVKRFLFSEAGFFAYLRFLTLNFKRLAHSYHYESAAALCLAVQHVCEGPEFFRRNILLGPILKEISGMTVQEKPTAVVRPPDLVYDRRGKRPILQRLLRKISLNGALLPDRAFRSKTLFLHKNYFGSAAQVFGYKKVHYEHEPLRVGYVLTFDRARLFGEAVRFIKTMWRFGWAFRRLRSEYRQALPEMTSRGFWEDVYRAPPPG